MKMVLLPIMYKLGVITTLLAMLTVFSLKGLSVGVLLLALGLGSLFSKLKHGGSHHWDGWSEHKDVHVHLHPYKPFISHHGWDRNHEYYGYPDWQEYPAKPYEHQYDYPNRQYDYINRQYDYANRQYDYNRQQQLSNRIGSYTRSLDLTSPHSEASNPAPPSNQ